MKKTLITLILCIVHCALCISQTIYKFAIHDEINSKTWIYTKEALNEANTLNPDLIIVGGGISKDAEHFLPLLDTRAPIVPATMRNSAGIIGAAALGSRLGKSPQLT